MDKTKTRVNDTIRSAKVRLIDAQGQQVGIVSRENALQTAKEAGLDLVEVSSPGAEMPVCRVMDYGKFKFKQRKARKKQKHRTRLQLKELKFRPTTDESDYQVKRDKASRFLNNGNKVKITMRYRGREMVHQELGMRLVKRLQEDLNHEGTVEQEPKQEGRQIVMILAPKKGNNAS